MRPVAVVGNLALDSVDGGPLRIGGAPYYAARALGLLARPAQIIVRCAQADRAALLQRLVALGVPVAYRGGQSTATFAIRYRNGLREMHVEAAGDTWTVEEARALLPQLRRVGWLHVGPLLRSDFPPETLALLARGHRITLDGQGLVRRGTTGPLVLDADYDPAVLTPLSALKLGEEEADVLLDRIDERSLASFGVPEVLVTFGERGSLVFAEGRCTEVKARAVHDVDPTGAGDAYMAGYISARDAGLAPIPAARRATALVERLLAT